MTGQCTWCGASPDTACMAAEGVCVRCRRNPAPYVGLVAGCLAWGVAAWLLLAASWPVTLVLAVAGVTGQAFGYRTLRRMDRAGTTVRGWALFSAGLIPTGLAVMAAIAAGDRIREAGDRP